MLSPILTPNCFVATPYAVAALKCPGFRSVLFLIAPNRCRKAMQSLSFSLDFISPSDAQFIGFSHLKSCIQDCLPCRCKESEGVDDLRLESELLEFMKKSENPAVFPTKKQLLGAGRMDLVDAILKQGGWLSWGWELDDDGTDNLVEDRDVTKPRLVIPNGTDTCRLGVVGSVDTLWETDVSSNPSHSVTSSSRPLEVKCGKDMGIEGILYRLKEQRNASVVLGLQEKENNTTINGYEIRDIEPKTPEKAAENGRNTLHSKKDKLAKNGSITDYSGLKKNSKSEMWRTWNRQRAGNRVMDFEAGEIPFDDCRIRDSMDSLKDGAFSTTESSGETINKGELNSFDEDGNCNQIQGEIQELELELSSTLNLLRNKCNETSSQDQYYSPETLEKFSDAWEFQQNEVINIQNRLRSIRTRLAVSEGVMALALIDAQKTLEEKRKSINSVHKALDLLRTVCIIWPNPASDVLLAGSYDGWTTQRKMERSKKGVFSLWLMLYPGNYEIKFIVDGTWRNDPLRPIVNNRGNENNLLIIA